MASNKVKIVITVDDKGSPVIKQFATGAKRDLGAVGTNAVESAKKMKAAWLGAAAALGLVAAGITKLSKETIAAYEKQRRAVEGMETVFKSMGRTTPGLADEMLKLSSTLQGLTNYGDEATLEGVKFLATYKDITDDLLPRTTKAMLDLAAATGRDTVTAANMLGKASMGMTGELRRVGISVDQDTFKAKGYLGVLEEIEKQFGGQAEVMSDPWTRLGNAIGDTKETLGGFLGLAFRPYAEDMIALLRNTNAEWKSLSERIKETQRVELEYELAQIKRRTEMGEFVADMGGIGVDFVIKDEVTDDEKAMLEKKAQLLQRQLDLLMGKVSEEGAGGGGGDKDRRTAEEAAAIELKERAIIQAAELAEEKLRIETERMNKEIELEQEKENALAEMRSQAVMDAKEAAEQKLRADIQRMNAEIAAEKKQIESDKQLTKQWFEESLAMAAQHSKTAWRAYQAYRIAEAIVDTIEAAQASYRWGASWGGPIAGAAMAAIATAAGIMRVQAIAKEKPQAAEGGVYSGPRAGYDVTMHGTEAVVPLPGGRGIPVDLGGGVPSLNVTIQAMDAKSFADMTDENPDAILGPFINALQLGHRGLTSTLRDTTQGKGG